MYHIYCTLKDWCVNFISYQNRNVTENENKKYVASLDPNGVLSFALRCTVVTGSSCTQKPRTKGLKEVQRKKKKKGVPFLGI